MKKAFTKPSEQEIITYLTETKNYDLQAATAFGEKFWNYYESCGWKVGKKPMVSWVAAIRTWELNNKTKLNEANRGVVKPDNRGTSASRIEALKQW